MPAAKNKIDQDQLNQHLETIGVNQNDANQTLMVWKDLKEKLKTLKDGEIKLRAQVLQWFSPHRKVGSSRTELGNDYQLVVSISEKPVIDVPAMEAFQKEDEAGLVDSIITWEPKLNKKAWSKLTEVEKGRVAEFLSFKEESPQVSIQEPK